MTGDAPSPGMVARRLTVRGRVQGVFYRGWTVETASALGLEGWVRNRLSGDVEIVAVGPAEAVEALVERCRRGPPAARVEAVEVEDAEPGPVEGFRQRPTA
jgi:acylphosphatase